MLIDENDLAISNVTAPLSDPHGQAALLLIESLIHGLCDNSVLDVPQAVAIVERAVDVQRDYVHAASQRTANSMLRAQALLEAIAASLNTDEAGPWPPPRLVSR
jgi:hypothetical protein